MTGKFLILFAMMFFHVWDDFGRQGIMASMKQRSWWVDQPEYSSFYSKDFIVALLWHSFSWACMIHIPIVVYMLYMYHDVSMLVIVSILINTYAHMITDNAKANDHTINLVIDQSIHVIQMLVTWLVLVVLELPSGVLLVM